MLNLRVDVVAREREFVLEDGGSNRLPRHEVADRAGQQEPEKQHASQKHQQSRTGYRRQFTEEVHRIYNSSGLTVQYACKPDPGSVRGNMMRVKAESRMTRGAPGFLRGSAEA